MMGFSQKHQLLNILLVVALAPLFRQSHQVLAWTPPSSSMKYDIVPSSSSPLKMSPSEASSIETHRIPALVTTTADSHGDITIIPAKVDPVDDYTHTFASSLEEHRKELEEVNGVDLEVTKQPSETHFDYETTVAAAPTTTNKGDHLEQALTMVTTGLKVAFQAIRLVTNETVHAVQSWDVSTTTFASNRGIAATTRKYRDAEPITTYGEAFAKIAKSGRGLLKLMELAKDSLVTLRTDMLEATSPLSSPTVTTTFRGTRRVPEPLGISATLAVVNDKDTVLASSTFDGEAITQDSASSQITYRPTISLCPAKASALWGYTVEMEENSRPVKPVFSLEQHFQDGIKNAGHWADHVLATAGKNIQNKILESAAKVDDQHEYATTATTTGPGPTYFLNVHDTKGEATLPVAQHQRRNMMQAQHNIFFFAN